MESESGFVKFFDRFFSFFMKDIPQFCENTLGAVWQKHLAGNLKY